MERNLFVLGIDDFNLRQLRAIRNADNDRFHPLSPPAANHVGAGQVIRARQLPAQSPPPTSAHNGCCFAVNSTSQ
ncbi:MAG: hypothetical protein VBE63_18530 [Lamprobacter sp.]|uniref:hypothetical protein n=1 Tax=Lamprobacter sp. TaxID=3100796 RepID=UPI002B2583A4|nr:hypothetical protein [Lamprobacter sp.]MEA3641913.1 hypothetical protein [Lamprobacter sp.]